MRRKHIAVQTTDIFFAAIIKCDASVNAHPRVYYEIIYSFPIQLAPKEHARVLYQDLQATSIYTSHLAAAAIM